MHVKRFEASTTAEAVRAVREELGDDALVLSVRKLRRGRGPLGLFGKACVEVTASVDRHVRKGEDPLAEPRPAKVVLPGSEPLLARAVVAPLESELKMLRAELRALRAGHAEDEGAIRDELEALRRMLTGSSGDMYPHGHGGSRYASTLGRCGLAMRHLEKLSTAAQGLATEENLDVGVAQQRALAQMIEARTLLPRTDRPERIDLFVGAAGVGKTTTLAKIAAQDDERDDRVSLLTTDTFRIGAEEQLRTYADLLQVSFATAVSPKAVGDQVDKWRGQRILIDSAGRGRSDREAMGDLQGIRQALGERAAVHLVVSAESRESVLREQIRRYAPLHPNSIIVTKTDESDQLTDITNVLLDETTPPLLWLGTGQRVPEDLRLPDPAEIAERILEDAA